MRNLSVVCIIFTFVVSLLLPLAFLVIYALRHKKQGIWSAWLLGAAGFVVPQICIRLQLMNVLSARSGFQEFTQTHPVLYALGMAFSAGLFELAGRFAVAMLLRKKLTYRRALAAGLGHGGIEAMLIVGMAYINNLVFLALIQTGGFDAFVAQTAAAGVDVTYLKTIPDTLTATPSVLYLLAGFERLLTMTCHAAMSMIVCYAIYRKRILPGLLICLAIHTTIDSVAGISLMIGKGLTRAAAYTIIYILLTAVTVLSILILKKIRSRWEQEIAQEVPYDSQA